MERELRALLEQRTPDGKLVFSDEDVRAVLPVVAMAVARVVPDVVFPRFVMELIGAVAQQAGVKASATPEQATAALSQYYAKHPLPARLVAAVERLLAGEMATLTPGAARNIARVIGATVTSQPLDSGVRPQGTVKAGPSARFAAMAALPSKKRT